VQQSSLRITREFACHTFNRLSRPFAHNRRAFRQASFEIDHSLTQTRSIELIDGERANAALGAARLAQQPRAAFSRGFGKSRIHNLDEFTIAGG